MATTISQSPTAATSASSLANGSRITRRSARRSTADQSAMDRATLKQTFTSLLAEARGLAPQYQTQIQDAARTIDTRSLVSLVKQA